ncbi:MAG: YcaQ family DNA glycosylase [Nocardioides sp.]|nr:YcaQ family DNA glycosylase [Nocardioides sp.]
MTGPHQLSQADARRVAVRAQLLDAERPADLTTVLRHLTVLQHDPISAVAPSADLVLWSRLGPAYDPAELRDAVDEQRVVDLHGLLRPAEDIALFRAEMARWPGSGELRDWQVQRVAWVEANAACRLDLLERLRADGPLPIRELPDTCEVPWGSSGWTNNKNVQRLLGFMVQRGEVASAGGWGKDRLWDLAERVYPDDPVPPADEADLLLRERRLRSLGIARVRVAEVPGEPYDVGEPAVVDGVKGEWRVDPHYLDGAQFAGRAALLSPFDRLVADRKRLAELFDYEYLLEMYKPAAKRRWGYYALPVLYGDRLIGKLDATADRAAGVLRVTALHEDQPFAPEMRAAVEAEIDALARWLDLEAQRD